MEALEEKVEEEQREEELKALEVSDTFQDVEAEASGEQASSKSDGQNHFDCRSIDTSQLPASYQTNTLQEEKLLALAAHFQQQYKHLCPARQPLFLHPANECGVQKFVSTTLRPTLLPYSELYNWDGCASFISDFLTMEPLKCPLTLPTSLYSPTTILSCQRGNCFDFSVLLCSLLLGAGYNAYCVHGYATREMCNLDQSLELCPLLSKPQQRQVPKEGVEKSTKYRVKPLLLHMAELQQEDMEKAELEAAEKSKGREKEEEVEEPRADPWHGLRVHAWVLVLAGKREVTESFFINPFTGSSHSTRDEHFLGIESIWNHKNFWVNMQDCRGGCKDLLFHLGDGSSWEAMLSGSTRPPQASKEEKELLERDEDDLQGKEQAATSLDMPPSWVAQLQLSPTELQTRYPQGRKVTLYKKAKLEKWAPYQHEKGLVQRLSCYTDLPCTEVVEVREWFKHREDMLERREVNKQTQLSTDYFSPGHLFHLKAHSYTSLEPEAERRMEFYHEARADDLQRCHASASRLTEHFVGRADLLHLLHVEFAEGEKKPTLDGSKTGRSFRPVVLIKESFQRNPAKPAEEDVAEVVFRIPERKIHLTYHLDENSITASKREFFQVAERDMEGQKIFRTHEMCITYEVGSSEKGKSRYQLYKLFQRLSKEEQKLKEEIQQFEAEVLDILKMCEEKEAAVKLFLPISDTERDEKRRQQHEAMKSTVEEKLPGPEEQPLDFLAPFLRPVGHGEPLSRRQALRVRESCLADLRQQLRHRLSIIQDRLEKVFPALLPGSVCAPLAGGHCTAPAGPQIKDQNSSKVTELNPLATADPSSSAGWGQRG
ncbi:dynein regulatory complex subunit 7 [Pogoniulus pusillus]|uniref:dynein regulatory complex subunit 7 n=1 Tax=Pogoniulus pusillus TaxID=488313 RepID=UPI0030B98B2E